MKNLTALFMVLILYVVAPNLIPAVHSAVSIITTPTYSGSTASLTGLYELLFVIIGLMVGFKVFQEAL